MGKSFDKLIITPREQISSSHQATEACDNCIYSSTIKTNTGFLRAACILLLRLREAGQHPDAFEVATTDPRTNKRMLPAKNCPEGFSDVSG